MALLGETNASVAELEHLLSIASLHSPSSLRLDARWDPLREHLRLQALAQSEPVVVTRGTS